MKGLYEPLAHSVADAVKAQQDAQQFIDRMSRSTGDGHELLDAVAFVSIRSQAYRRAYRRLLQKNLERSGNGSE